MPKTKLQVCEPQNQASSLDCQTWLSVFARLFVFENVLNFCEGCEWDSSECWFYGLFMNEDLELYLRNVINNFQRYVIFILCYTVIVQSEYK